MNNLEKTLFVIFVLGAMSTVYFISASLKIDEIKNTPVDFSREEIFVCIKDQYGNLHSTGTADVSPNTICLEYWSTILQRMVLSEI